MRERKIEGYASDVTRTFPVSAEFSGIQRELYNVVLAAQQEAIAGGRSGHGVQIAAHAGFNNHRAGPGRCQDPARSGRRIWSAPTRMRCSSPMVWVTCWGLSTHDCGGYLDGRAPEDRFGLAYLRADLPLAPGYVVTIEPGVYFVPALLSDPARRERYAGMVNWDVVDRMLDFGGIRIEDDVLIMADGCEVMSGALPSAAKEIEAIRRDALGVTSG